MNPRTRSSILASLTLLCGLAARLGAEEYAGLSLTNATWSDGLGFNDRLSYEFKTKLYTKLEGKWADGKTGLSLGVNVDFDNNDIGKANRVLGYVGFRRIFLRAAASDMKGSVKWDGSRQLPAFRQPAKLEFKDHYSYVDLVYYTKKISLFFGAGYTSYSLPTEIKAYSSPDGKTHYERVGAYDPDYAVKLYNAVFGFDTLASAVFMNSEMGMKPKDGLGFFMAMEDRFGIGNATVSPATIQVLKNNNPGYAPQKATGSYWLIENDSNMGLKWTKTLAGGRSVAVGVGYEFAFIIGTAFSGVAKNPKELEIDPTHGLIRQGPMTRVYCRF